MANENLVGTSNDASVAAVSGTNTSGGIAVAGISDDGNAIHAVSRTAIALLAESKSGRAVEGRSQSNFGMRAVSITSVGLRATSVEGRGIEAQAEKNGIALVAQSDGGDGVLGISKSAVGVHGKSETNFGMRAGSVTSVGLRATSVEGRGIEALAEKNGIGLVSQSTGGDGVLGISKSAAGVHGKSETQAGVLGISVSGIGVHGKGGRLAALFEGDVEVTKDIRFTNGADCAEEFDILGPDKIEPGTVMVLGIGGALVQSEGAYDRRVAGVISGAGDYKPGIVLDSRASDPTRQPVALVGKVFCKVEAISGAIDIGDLLTTSPMPGHAMKAVDPSRVFGAVIGKALRPLASGRDLIPILVALQ